MNQGANSGAVTDASIDSEGGAVAVIENVLWRADWEVILLGDIFLERGKATFVPYGGFRSSAPVVSGAAAVFGGFTGAIANRLLDGSIGDALPHAKKARTLQWGLPPCERAENTRSIEIPRQRIDSFETSGGLAIRESGSTHLFGYAFAEDAAESGKLFSEWRAGKLDLHPSAKKAGLDIAHPPPQPLLQSFLAGRATLGIDGLEKLSKDGDYMKHFLAVFGTMKNQEREQLLKCWQSAPAIFKSMIAQFMREQSQGSDRFPKMSLAVFILACIGIIYAVHGFFWISSHEHELKKGSFEASGLKEIGAAFASVFAAIFSAIAFGTWCKKRAYMKQLTAFVGSALPLSTHSLDEQNGLNKAAQANPAADNASAAEVSGQVLIGQVWAGILTGVVFGGGGSFLLWFLCNLGSATKPGLELRAATMGLWAFLGAYASGALLSARMSAARMLKSLATILVSGFTLGGIGYLTLRAIHLYDRDADTGMVALPAVMGIILGAFVYVWMHDNLPFLFPFLGRQNADMMKKCAER